MRTEFKNSSQQECAFDDEGITFYGVQQEVVMPYGCLDTVNLSLLGIFQATSGKRICTFAVDRKDRGQMKEMIKYAKNAMKTAPEAEVRMIDLTAKDEQNAVSGDLSPEEQLKQYKMQFIQGVISKDEYEARKHMLKGN